MQVVPHFSLPFTVTKLPGKQVIAPVSTISSQSTPRPTIQSAPIRAQHAETHKSSGLWETGSFSFRDILDAINPLQHIPIISTIYRKLTGDKMGYASRIAGDTLFGGVFGSFISGAISAIANVFVDAFTGKDIGEHMIAAVAPAAPSAASPATYAKIQPAQPVANQVQPRQQTILVDQIINPNQAGTAPLRGASKAQAAINQYKWQTLAGEVKHHSNYWA